MIEASTPAVQAPANVNKLRGAITAAAKIRGATLKRFQALVGNVVVSQVLPDSAIKGGTGLKLRFGDRVTRETPDLDTAFHGDREAFLAELNEALKTGWGGFSGTAIAGEMRAPDELRARVGDSYIMQPVRVKLTYNGKDFMSVELEIGHDELQATTNEPAETAMSAEVLEVFAELGLPQPAPVRVLPLHHQISQKLHACTEPGSNRAHDLVDLQLLIPDADAQLVSETTQRLFRFRNQHTWPPVLVAGPAWLALYDEASEGLDLRSLEDAVDWINEYIRKLN